ncbi:MAG: hypothetical protein M9962_07905, partial [Oligoflexia bacterium]|nr:hypothetical protein [Oligoflexia bacterium]
PFYGSASSFSKLSVAARKEQLKKLRLPPELVDQMQPVSCIGLALKCLKRGFHNAGQEAVWKQIETFTVKNNGSGMALQDALQNLGWRVLYWNPNVSMNEIWDQREQAKNPNNTDRFWGYHAYRWATINKNQKYYYNYVDDYSTLVNFGESVPRSILRTPFFVGTAHTGYHVFPGAYGQIIEGHSTRAITDSQTVESSPFNPLATGGGPRGLYRSGLMAVPPGY